MSQEYPTDTPTAPPILVQPILVQPTSVQPIQPGTVQPVQPWGNNQASVTPMQTVQPLPAQQIEMATFAPQQVGQVGPGGVPLAVAQPIDYVDRANLATKVNIRSNKTTYNHKNRLFLGSMVNNLLAIVVFVLFFAKFFSLWGPLTLTSDNGPAGTLKYIGCYNKSSRVTLPMVGESFTFLGSGESKLKCFLPPKTVVAAGNMYKCGTTVLHPASSTSSSSGTSSSTSGSRRRRRRRSTNTGSTNTGSTNTQISSNGENQLSCEAAPINTGRPSLNGANATASGASSGSNSENSRSLNPSNAPIGYRGYTFFMFHKGYTPSSVSDSTSSGYTAAYTDLVTDNKVCSSWELVHIVISGSSDSKHDCGPTSVCGRSRIHSCEKSCRSSASCKGDIMVKFTPTYAGSSYSSFQCYAENSLQGSECSGGFHVPSDSSKRNLYRLISSSSSNPANPINVAMHSALPSVSANGGYKNPDSSYCYNVGINPVNSELFTKIDDLHCGWDRRGGPLDEAIAVFQNPALVQNNATTTTTTDELIILIPFLALMIACPLLLLFYVCHGMCYADDINYLTNIMTNVGDPNKSNADEYFDMVTREAASLVMHVDCYHYETRTTGSGKNRSTKRVKVTTHRGVRNMNFNNWHDQTDSPTGLERFGVVKVLSIKDPITFADQYTSTEVNKQREQFKMENRHRDVHMSYNEVQDIKTFKKNVLFVRDDRNAGGCSLLSERSYQSCTLCCCNWFYRYWFECTAVRTTVHVSKVIQCVPGNNNYVMDGGGAGGGVKTNGGSNNNYEFNLLLQQLKTSFMNGQITAQQYELAQQQLTTQYAATNAAPSAPAMGHVQRRATLTPAELNKIKKQGGAGGTKCKWCFCGILIIVGVPLLLWFLFLGCGASYRRTRWCEDNNNPVTNGGATVAQSFIENYQFQTSSMYGDLCASDSGANGKCTSTSRACKDFTAMPNCQDAFSSFTPSEYDNPRILGCDTVIQSGVGGFCNCAGTGSTPSVAINVLCGHEPFTCKEMCENKCANGAACVHMPNVGDACVLASLGTTYKEYSSYQHGLNLNPFWIPTMTCKAYPAQNVSPNPPTASGGLYYPQWTPQITEDAVNDDMANDGKSSGNWNKWSDACKSQDGCQRWRNDGKCDEACNMAACGFDGLDCETTTGTETPTQQ